MFSRTPMGKYYHPDIYYGIVHAPQEKVWPNISGTQFAPFPKPKFLEIASLDWKEAIHFAVPKEMANPDPRTNLKYLAIDAYHSNNLATQ